MGYIKRLLGEGKGSSRQRANSALTSKYQLYLKGEEQLIKIFNDLVGFKERRQEILNAYKLASKPLIKKAKSNLKTRRKTKKLGSQLNKSIGYRVQTTGHIALLVGARTYGRFKGYHGHLINDGTKDRSRRVKSSGLKGAMGWTKKVSTGRVTANHFWDDALQSEYKEVRSIMNEQLVFSMNKLVDRNLIRMGK